MLDVALILTTTTGETIPSSWEGIKLVAEAVAAWLAIPGTLIAAIWVYYRFRNTETNTAKLEYEEAKRNFERLSSPSYLDGSIDHEVIEEQGYWVIKGEAKGKNIGKVNLTLNFAATDPIVISYLDADETGALKPKSDPIAMTFQSTRTYHSADIASGGSVSLDFAARVNKEGYYLIEFISRKSLKQPGPATEYDFDDWMLTKIIRVPTPPKAADEKDESA